MLTSFDVSTKFYEVSLDKLLRFCRKRPIQYHSDENFELAFLTQVVQSQGFCNYHTNQLQLFICIIC